MGFLDGRRYVTVIIGQGCSEKTLGADKKGIVVEKCKSILHQQESIQNGKTTIVLKKPSDL